MKRSYLYLISAATVALTLLFILLWILIPGFPLLVVFFLPLPPIIWWSNRAAEGQQLEEPSPPPPEEKLPVSGPDVQDKRLPRFCPSCGKRLLEPQESYCPRCGAPLH